MTALDDEEQGTLFEYLAHGPDLAADLDVQSKPGRAADHALGVMFQAPWETPYDGFAEYSRRCARALALTGCPVHLRSLTPHLLADEDEEHDLQREYADLTRASIGQYSAQIHQFVPSDVLLFGLVRHRHLNDDELSRVNRARVFSTMWERAPTGDNVDAMNRVGQNWVGCQANADMLADLGVTTPIHVVPVPYFESDPRLKLRGRKRRPGPPRFYHVGKWEPRKAQDQILGAFLRAFQPGEAELYLKTSSFASSLVDYPEPMTCAHGWLRDPAVRAQGWSAGNLSVGLKIFVKKIPEPQLIALHGHGDVYVSLSRGEGFDMPAFDAKLAGNLLIYTPSGGPQDFAHPVDYLVPATGSVPCHPFYKWDESATYLDFSIDDAIVAMRRAAAEVTEYPRSHPMDLSAFSAAAVGQSMLANLRELTDKVF